MVQDSTLTIRIPSELREAYEAWAKAETRSLSQQVLHVMRLALPPERSRVAAKKGNGK